MIYFVRHGQSTANLAHIFTDPKDNVGLTAQGEAEAQAVGEQIKAQGVKIDRIISSNLKRSSDTAQIIAKIIDFDPAKVEPDERLREYDGGSFAGQPEKDVSSQRLVQAPGAEDPHEFQARVAGALNPLKTSTDTILIVSHAGVGRMVETIKRGADPALFHDLPSLQNGEMIKLDL